MSNTTVLQYLTNVGHAILNRKENFDNGSANTSTATNTNTENTIDASLASQSLAVVILLFIILFILAVLNMYGAGRLSYCYNRYYGADIGLAWIWAVLSALFSGLYYPIYGIFLNPLCNLQKTGGRR
jgi:uncharacterized integral membrane protein